MTEIKRYCSKCGAELIPDSQYCNKCGAPINEKTNDAMDLYCLSGFILGIISFFIDAFGIISIIAIVLCAIGINKTKVNNTKGKTLGIIGLICGIIEFILKFIQLFILTL